MSERGEYGTKGQATCAAQSATASALHRGPINWGNGIGLGVVVLLSGFFTWRMSKTMKEARE